MAQKKVIREKLKPNFSERLITAMDKKGFTALSLSKAMQDICKNRYGDNASSFVESINRWRSNADSVLPGADYLFLLSLALDCDMEYLMGGQDEPQKSIEIAATAAGLSVDTINNISKYNNSAKQSLEVLSTNKNFEWFLHCVLTNITDEVKEKKENMRYSMDNAENCFKPIEIHSLKDIPLLEYHALISSCEDAIKDNIPSLVQSMVEYLIDKV